MAHLTNRQWILRRRPEGMVDPSLFELQETPVPALSDGQLLAQTLYLSFDPTQRAWMAMDSYMPAVELGEPMRAGGISQVIESKHPKYKAGDFGQLPMRLAGIRGDRTRCAFTGAGQ